MTVKEQIVEIVQKMPDDVTFEDALYKIELLQRIEIGLRQADAGEGIPHEEMIRRYGKASN